MYFIRAPILSLVLAVAGGHCWVLRCLLFLFNATRLGGPRMIQQIRLMKVRETLSQLNYFVIIIRCNNFNKSALRIWCSDPAWKKYSLPKRSRDRSLKSSLSLLSRKTESEIFVTKENNNTDTCQSK